MTCRGWVDGSWDAHLASPADFFPGADDITKRENLGSRLAWISNTLSNLRLLLVIVVVVVVFYIFVFYSLHDHISSTVISIVYQ